MWLHLHPVSTERPKKKHKMENVDQQMKFFYIYAGLFFLSETGADIRIRMFRAKSDPVLVWQVPSPSHTQVEPLKKATTWMFGLMFRISKYSFRIFTFPI